MNIQSLQVRKQIYGSERIGRVIVILGVGIENIIGVRMWDEHPIYDVMVNKQRDAGIIGAKNHHHQIVKGAQEALFATLFVHFLSIFGYKDNVLC